MKDYTYKDIAGMQEQAKQRVMEMQKRSKFALEEMNRDINSHTKPTGTSAQSVIMPQQPRNIQYPVGLSDATKDKNGKTGEKNRKPEHLSDNENIHSAKEQGRSDIKSMFHRIFGDLSRDDSEKMLILSLCLLLTSEQSDEGLILALLYLLS